MNLPNTLTFSRFFLAAVFMILLFSEGVFFKSLALIVFTLACFTDYWDGILARSRKEITLLGQLLDPLADKVLTFSAFLSFVEMGILPAWMVLLMLLREIFVTGFRFAGASKGIALPAEQLGKIKTVIQIISIFVILILLCVLPTRDADPPFESPLRFVIQWGMMGVVLFTIYSGIHYALRYRKIIS